MVGVTTTPVASSKESFHLTRAAVDNVSVGDGGGIDRGGGRERHCTIDRQWARIYTSTRSARKAPEVLLQKRRNVRACIVSSDVASHY